jgi:2-amino-4-hydroxy-6-hydroxymethyldihydropteridine diphosphokinase
MILIALGANLPSIAGAPVDTLHAALAVLSDNAVRLEGASPVYSSPAWPDPLKPAFVNAVARIETTLSPAALLDLLHRIEAQFERERTIKNAPRTLDLDLLDYDGRVAEGPPQLPHPRLAERGFVLLPLRDIAPEWQHPINGLTVQFLIEALPAPMRDSVKPLA